MPTYDVDFDAGSGPTSARFSIDQERPLGSQVGLILSELSQMGLTLQGTSTQELIVLWDGLEVDGSMTPEQLGMGPERALTLAFRSRKATVRVHRPEPPTVPFVTRAEVAFPFLAAWLGVAAWVFGLGTPWLLTEPAPLQAAVGPSGVFGAFMVAGLWSLDAAWRWESTLIPALAGVLVGAVFGSLAGLLSSLVGLHTPLGHRMAGWAILGCVVGGATAFRWALRQPRRLLEGVLCGAVAGGLGGALSTLPGPADFWLATAFGITGAGIGFGVVSLPFRRAPAVLQLVDVAGRPPRWLGHREWSFGRDARVPLFSFYPGKGLKENGRVRWSSGRVTYSPRDNAENADRVAPSLLGKPMETPTELLNDDRVTAGAARYRLLKRYVTPALILPLLLNGCGEVREGQTVSGRSQIVACVESGSDMCLKGDVRVTGPALVGEVNPDAWSVEVRGLRLPAMAVTAGGEGEPRLRLAVVVDLSASMGDGTLSLVRSALRSFLTDLPPSAEVMLTGFSSRDVRTRIEGATFGSPEDALGALSDLPAPHGNTALYSAVEIAANRVLADLGTGLDGVHLVVITDGNNDVGNPGDDPGLLAGPQGRSLAREAVDRGELALWVVGIGGQLNREPLDSLASGLGASLPVPFRDPVLIAHAFRTVSSSLDGRRSVFARLPFDAYQALNRGPTETRWRALDSTGRESAFDLPWVPPQFVASLPGPIGIPVGVGEVAGSSTGELNAPRSVPTWNHRPFPRAAAIVGLYALVTLLLSQVLPQRLWPVETGAAVRGSTEKRRLKSGKGKDRSRRSERTKIGDLVLLDAQPAPPRGVEDITRSRAVRE